MNCLYCGTISDHYLCEHCRTEEVLDNVFHDICFYKPETCENPYVTKFVSGFANSREARTCIPEILGLFDKAISEYYFCRYYRICRDPLFEGAAIAFIASHRFEDTHTQNVLHDLLESYQRNEFVKPRKWCDQIVATDHLCCELYEDAAQYYSMVGEYDLSDQVVEKALGYCVDDSVFTALFCQREGMIAKLNKQKDLTCYYRTKRPYWPNTEERRRVVAMFYDEKGITYPRIESKPQKTPEDQFAPINEYCGADLQSYCTFWCSEAFGAVPAKCTYEIAAVRVRNGAIVEEFSSLIRPWDGESFRKSAAKQADLPLEIFQQADDVDIVLKKFFDFIGPDVLVSTGALGNQLKLLSRAARYAGMTEIKNEILDILDLAAEKDPVFDLANNTREYLLQHFSVAEGKFSLEKAHVNAALYKKLCNYGKKNG